MNIELIRQNASAAGHCGDGLAWYHLDTALYIEGHGEIAPEAFSGKDSIREVKIAPGCTGIGDRAFEGCLSLTKVELPEGLERIGKRAFALQDCCDQDRFLMIPDSVTEIGQAAFLHVSRVRYKGPARSDDHWGAEHLESYAALPAGRVALHCRICGRLNDKKLTTGHPKSYPGARIAAYPGGICMFPEIPAPGTDMEITVESPFCCDIGDTFWAEYFNHQCDWGREHKHRYAQAQLLSIVERGPEEAKLLIRILEVKDWLSFVKPVPEKVKKRLKKIGSHHFAAPAGDAPNPRITEMDANIVCYANSYGGGDIDYDSAVYTDPDGIDHLIKAGYSDFDTHCVFVGDEVLGYHSNHPYQWENGLLIDRNEQMVLECSKEASEIIIPDGIETLGHCCFYDYPNLARVVIPDSVEYAFNAFDVWSGHYPNLKEIVLTGNSQLEDDLFPKGISIVREFPENDGGCAQR